MSDGFDKEAEREKLREKLARDDEKREHTQRMSELLLQGATMTNRHCDDCGDPIFRHDGREFCPTCQSGGSSDTERAAGTNAGTDGSSSPETTGVEPADTSLADTAETTPETPANGEAASGGVGSTAPPTGSEPRAETRANEAIESGGRGGDRSEAFRPPDTGRGKEASPSRAADDRAGERSGSGSSRTVGDARESLTETLVRFAREAETTDDPRRARDHLRAAREAAEALAALE